MLKIAIVDDNEKDRDRISKIVYKIGDLLKTDFDVNIFKSGFELFEAMSKTTFDVILLDIQMDEIDGVAVLKEIHKLNSESYIIFISSYKKRWKELFEENVLGFISKSKIEAELTEKIKLILNRLESGKVFKYLKNGKKNIVLLSDILCLTSNNHYMIIHTKTGLIEYKGKTSEVWDELKDNYWFFMPNRSSVVNFKYTKYISRTEIQVGKDYEHGAIMTITKNFREDSENRFLRYAEMVGN